MNKEKEKTIATAAQICRRYADVLSAAAHVEYDKGDRTAPLDLKGMTRVLNGDKETITVETATGTYTCQLQAIPDIYKSWLALLPANIKGEFPTTWRHPATATDICRKTGKVGTLPAKLFNLPKHRWATPFTCGVNTLNGVSYASNGYVLYQGINSGYRDGVTYFADTDVTRRDEHGLWYQNTPAAVHSQISNIWRDLAGGSVTEPLDIRQSIVAGVKVADFNGVILDSTFDAYKPALTLAGKRDWMFSVNRDKNCIMFFNPKTLEGLVIMGRDKK